MNLKITRVVYSFFILIFFIFGSYLLFYGMGYRINFYKGKIEKTGALFIKSYPRDALIYLNGLSTKKNTPTLINRLLPNDYQIKITKPGYFDWEKTLTVYPRLTTFAEDITLFKNEIQPKLIAAADYRFLKLSPDKEKAVLIGQNDNQQQIEIYDLTNKKNTLLYSTDFTDKLDFVEWCNTSNKFLIKNNNDFWLFNLESKIPTSVRNQTKLTFDSIKCDYYNDNILYGIASQNLYKIDLLNKNHQLLLKDKIVEFLPWKTNIFAVTKDDEQYFLRIFSQDKWESLLVLPPADNYDFYPSATSLIALHNSQQQEVYLLYPDRQPIYQQLLKNVDHLVWHDDQLIFWNKSEIWVYFPEDDKKILIERVSSSIENAFWHSGVVNIFGQIDQKLKVYELDDRSKRNFHELMDLSPKTKDNIFVNKKGTDLYLLTEIDGVFGLYQVEIQ